MENETLVLELLHEVKCSAKRWFIAFLVTLLLLFATNMAWLYVWSLPVEETTETIMEIEQDTDGNGTNNFIGDDGDING